MFDAFFMVVGQLVVYSSLLLLALAGLAALFIIYSFKTERFLFPGFTLSIIVLMESLVKGMFRFFNIDDSIVDTVGIQLKNKVGLAKFSRIPFEKRMVFLPQCLRSPDCPSKLSQEGLCCIGCGRCEICNARKVADDLGCMMFVVPGSSFIRRMIRKYRPGGILGVGCMNEVKDGLDLCRGADLPAIGITLSKAGCVSTILDWDMFYEMLTTKTD